MARNRIPQKKAHLLNFFQTDQSKPDRQPEKERSLAGLKKANVRDVHSLPPDFRIFQKKIQTAKVAFITHTEEISFEDFLRFRPDKYK